MHAMRRLDDEEPTKMMNKERNLASERPNKDLAFSSSVPLDLI